MKQISPLGEMERFLVQSLTSIILAFFFRWTDWGGCGHPSGKNIGNLWWANYLYHQDQSRTVDGKRGLVLSRFGGLGTHRYGVGFSGDAPQSYHTLQMQVEMTPKASNVLFGYWSHDM
jgi:alpha-glucosidase (family GH31 glycosyl hydrolase)